MGRGIKLPNDGLPMPVVPTENIGMMSGAIRKKRGGRRDGRGSRRGFRSSGLMQVTMQDPKTGKMYGGLVKDGVPQFKAPDGSTPRSFPKVIDPSKIPVSRRIPREFDSTARREVEITRRRLEDQPGFDPSKPSAVMETERVNVQDPTLGGPPEREVPIPKERDTSPRGPAPFSPDERAMARDAFFEKMFSRADERKQSRAMDQEERRNVMDARRDEAAMRGGERGMRDERGGRRRGRRMRRRDFTRKRSKMEGRRSREERAAFRDRFVSTLR